MSAGGQIASGASSFGQAMAAVYIGYAILFLIAMATSVISMRTGLSFGLISRFSFGTNGAKLISFFTTVTLCGWFSINCYLMGDVTHVLFPAIPRWPVTLLFGALMVFSALKGQKVMNFIGMFACVAVFVVGITAVVVGIRDASSVYQGGIFAIQKDAQMTMTQLKTVLEKLGVEEIPAQGESFDPNVHNAVMHMEDEALGENTVVEVFQAGFKMGEKVIRHAMVKVAN